MLTRHPELQRSIEEMSAGPLADGTMKNYKGMLKKLQVFCQDKKYDYDKLMEAIILHFLAELNHKGANYSALNQVKPDFAGNAVRQCFSIHRHARADRWPEGAKTEEEDGKEAATYEKGR